jgi:Transmembrane domain of unknown function (DUF3566)
MQMTDTSRKFASKGSNPTRQVRLTLRYVSVWSATKIAFLSGVGLGIVAGITTMLLWAILNQFGMFAQLAALFSGTSAGSSSVKGVFGFTQALGVAALLGPLNTLAITLFGLIGAALYNFGVRVMGGATVGFSPDN